jgi:rubrerythrin
MNTVTDQQVLQEVQELLQQAIERLESRQHEMSQEVVNHFQQSNMQAIEVLMKEKHKHEQIVLGIQQVLATSEQQ